MSEKLPNQSTLSFSLCPKPRKPLRHSSDTRQQNTCFLLKVRKSLRKSPRFRNGRRKNNSRGIQKWLCGLTLRLTRKQTSGTAEQNSVAVPLRDELPKTPATSPLTRQVLRLFDEAHMVTRSQVPADGSALLAGEFDDHGQGVRTNTASKGERVGATVASSSCARSQFGAREFGPRATGARLARRRQADWAA